jgi:hypothetical protein
MYDKPNFKRMIALIDEVFATRNDPDQLQVNEKAIKKLNKIHEATLSEHSTADGPAVWVLLIPTTASIMNDFLSGKISEQGILDNTPLKTDYQTIYLCSATALPEFRGKGITKKICLDAIAKIKETHKIDSLFVWSFTKEGAELARKIAKECDLPLMEK